MIIRRLPHMKVGVLVFGIDRFQDISIIDLKFVWFFG